MPHGKLAGAERVLLELLAETPPGMVVVCAPRDSPLGAAVAALGHRIRDFSLPKFREAGPWRYIASYARALRTLRRIVLDEGVEVIHGFVAFTIKAVIPVARMTKTPALVSVHEMTTSESIGGARSLLQRYLASRSALRITAVSQYVATALVSMGYPSDRVVVIYNGIDRATPRSERSVARACLGLPGQSLVFLMPGRLTRWKGQLVAIDAFDRFCQDHPDLRAELLVVGGPFEATDRDYEAALRQRISDSGASEHIHMYGYRADVDVFYDASDVVLVPSIEPEPLGMVVLEAGLAARPAIVTDLGGAPEALLDGTTGLVASPTAVQFERAMSRAADPEWRELAGRKALQHIEEQFSRSRFAQGMFAEWAKVAEPGARRSARENRDEYRHPVGGGRGDRLPERKGESGG
jgi:glycosyltransferase involved in cell wall biosynthesis